MLPSSHEFPRKVIEQPNQGELAEAFSAFISASARLEHSYRELQAEVAELSSALSERNQALNQSLSEKRRLDLTLERILEAIPCGVLVVDEEGMVRLANRHAVELLALPGEQTRSLTLGHKHAGLDFLSTLLVTMDVEQEIPLERSAGKQWLAVRCVSLPRESGSSSARQAGQFIVTVRDISARKKAEQDRESARDAVALAQVSAVLAHEIRNPLASLELFTGLLQDSPEQADEWLFHLRAGIRSLSGTVNNVLLLNGESVASMERLNLHAEARLATRFLQPLAQRANVALSLELGGEECFISANRSAFHQLLLNLCSNALRHTQSGGRVSIRCNRPKRRSVLLEVSDTGSGIAPEALPRIFEGGFSGTGTTPGLGLAVCERLMQQHGGVIRVQSRLGHGSTFTLEFPTL